jgi:hypothetical protein
LAITLTLWERAGVRVVGEAHIGREQRNGIDEITEKGFIRDGPSILDGSSMI